jgi:hypothetical protein
MGMVMQAEIREFDRTIAIAKDASAVWDTLRILSQAIVGHRLFTVMTVDMTAGLARRAYSDHPADYPVSGTKPIHRDGWFDIVHGERRSFIANTIEDIAQVFPDYELIASLGCGSVMNLPVVLKGDLVATINMLHAAQHYTAERVALAEAVLPVPAKLCCALAQLFDSGQKKPD